MGWVSIHRKILESDLWLSEKFTKGQAWIDLLLLANHERHTLDVRGNDVVIERGQVGWSEQSLANRWKWSRNRVRGFALWLKRYNRIDIRKSRILGVITILNYNLYQQIKQQTEQQTIQQKVQQKDTNNKDNNKNNIINIAEETSADIKKTIQEIENKEKIRHDYQYLGLELHSQLEAPIEKKSEFIRIVRDYPRPIIDQAYAFAKDYPVRAIKWKMFFKKFWLLIQSSKNENITKPVAKSA